MCSRASRVLWAWRFGMNKHALCQPSNIGLHRAAALPPRELVGDRKGRQ
jgi:hypothetical protein